LRGGEQFLLPCETVRRFQATLRGVGDYGHGTRTAGFRRSPGVLR
jgi:hypothetical protein